MKKTQVIILIILLFPFIPSTFTNAECNVPIAFYVALLSPNTNHYRNQWSLLIQQQLPKIGIGVYLHESTNWENIGRRTWYYPFIDHDYIPTYAEGGYDMLFVGYNFDIDWNPLGIFDIYGYGWPYLDNFYQYINPLYDSIISQYYKEPEPGIRINYAHQLQAILYEDLPAISIVYPRVLYGFKEGLTGIDGLLLSLSEYRIENWDDPEDHIIKYAIPNPLTGNLYNAFRQEGDLEALWLQGVYGSLFKRGQDHHMWEGEIAIGYNVSGDNKNITVYLDSNAKFSDGSLVLAEDVKYSYELYMSPAVNPKRYYYFSSWFASNDSIEIVDNQTINFNLTDVNCFFHELLSYGIIDKSVVEPCIATNGNSIFDEIPLTGNVSDVLVKSCGPMKLATYNETNSTVKLIPNPYWNETAVSGGNQPLLDEFQVKYIADKDTAMTELITGDIDIIDPDYMLFIVEFSQEGVEGVLVNIARNHELALNMKHPIFGTGELTPKGTLDAAKAIRKAISHAIPRQIIIDQILEGLGSPGVSPMPEACVGFDDSLEAYTYDHDVALDYMEDAGFRYMNPSDPGYTLNVPNILIMFIGITSMIIFRRFKKK